ncbi:hypothetical protein BpHYR1_026121 [Brachionus plicatilis]|uniref:Gustatory receptor n=1 Tax=Brachionus plicatilis TaxID=10195 RepID=A0A3M7T729_BRAPC|nr:hypothetical protein BpHYR1_026121 [Brachionus plicatilis]
MRIVGLFHRKNDKWFLKAYPLLVIIIQWLSFARLFSLFEFWDGGSDSLSAELVYKIIFILWCFLTSARAAFNSITSFISLFGSDYFFQAFSLFLAPFHKETWSRHNVPYKIFNNILISYSSFIWMITISYYLALCEMTVFIFKNFNRQFRNLVNNKTLVSHKQFLQENRYEVEDKFDELRKKHLKIGKTIQQMNKCYQQFVGIILIIYTTGLLMLLYIITDWNGHCIQGILTILYPFWTFCCLFILILSITFAARVQEKFSEILDDLLEVDLDEFNNSLCFKVNLMISKLTHGKPYLTAFGMININKEFILTIFGTLITYFIVVNELKSPNQTARCQLKQNLTQI